MTYTKPTHRRNAVPQTSSPQKLVTGRRPVPQKFKRQRSGLGQLLESYSLSSSMSETTMASSYESASSMSSSRSQPVQAAKNLFTAAAADATRAEQNFCPFDKSKAPKQIEFKNCHNCNALYASSELASEDDTHADKVRAIRSAFCSGECCLTYLSLASQQ